MWMDGENWQQLCTSVQYLAEAYAGTEPQNAYRYREEGRAFWELDPPATAEAFADRQADAEALRQRWSVRLRPNGAAETGA